MGDIRDSISKNISLYRKQFGLTQSQLAEKLGVKTTSVSSWERGANAPDIETLYDICQLFNITLDEMYGVANNEPVTMAAHFDGDEFTEDELDDIRAYAEFVKNRRNRS